MANVRRRVHTFPVQLATSRPGRGYRFTLGTGKAMVELESFMGTINLHRIQDSAKDKEKGKHKHKDNDKHDDE